MGAVYDCSFDPPGERGIGGGGAQEACVGDLGSGGVGRKLMLGTPAPARSHSPARSRTLMMVLKVTVSGGTRDFIDSNSSMDLLTWPLRSHTLPAAIPWGRSAEGRGRPTVSGPKRTGGGDRVDPRISYV